MSCAYGICIRIVRRTKTKALRMHRFISEQQTFDFIADCYILMDQHLNSKRFSLKVMIGLLQQLDVLSSCNKFHHIIPLSIKITIEQHETNSFGF